MLAGKFANARDKQ